MQDETRHTALATERRSLAAELRAEEGSRRVSGRAVVFDTVGYPCGEDAFEEVIERGAITPELIAASDVVFCLEHDEARGLLGRSRNGSGTLRLDLRDDGLYVDCELPAGALGDQVLEGVRRGDYSGMSFSFGMVPSDCSWGRSEGGAERRTITRISRLYDVSVVARPAYDASDIRVDTRGRRDESGPSGPSDTDTDTDTNVTKDTDMPDTITTPAPETEQEQRSAAPAPESAGRRNEFTPRRGRRADGGFSLVRAIRAAISNQPFDESEARVFARGMEEHRRANVPATAARIVLPAERRSEGMGTPDAPTVVAFGGIDSAAGAPAVATETLGILAPLYDSLVLARAGATVMTGLSGNVVLPAYSGSTASWEGETGSAQEGRGTFSKVTFSPHRLTAYLDVSNQFLIQDSANAEALLRADLVRCVQSKLEATILGADAGTDDMPAGLFSGVTAAITPTYAETVAMEQAVEEANAAGALHYIMSPAIKSALRSTAKDAGSGRFLMEGGDLNGIPALVTNAAKGIILGDFSEYVICQWGGVELVVDSISRAAEGVTRITVNSYWDAKPRRAGVFAARVKKPAS